MSLYSSIRTSVKTTTKVWLCQKEKNAIKSHKFIRKSQKPCTAPDHSNSEFSIVHERRHVTPCLSSAPSSTGYCERRHRSVDNVKSVGLEFKIWVGSFRLYVNYSKRSGTKTYDVMFKLRPFVHWLLSTTSLQYSPGTNPVMSNNRNNIP